MLNIVKFPNKILRERMPEFDFNDSVLFLDPVKLEKEMIETMLALDGIGLAANQIGIQTRVFVMGHRENPKAAQAFFNPMVVATTDEIEDLEEG